MTGSDLGRGRRAPGSGGPDIDEYELLLAAGGAAALIAAWLPQRLRHQPLSLPMFLVALGAVFFALPILPDPSPVGSVEVTERVTEIGVIVALMGAGLKIDRPVTWAGWRTTRRLLLVAMPLTIGVASVLGWALLGLGAASAILLGAVLAPTDPVLAADVQVGEPTVGDDDQPEATSVAEQEEGEDEVRFSLTSEAGLNDALAFPFVYLAMRLAQDPTDVRGWLVQWVAIDLFYRLAAGLVIGYLVGRALARLLFRGVGRTGALAEAALGFVAIAATLLAYGLAELAQGYGFLSVFVAAVTLRAGERNHTYHRVLHDFSEQAEQLLTIGLLLLFGGALTGGLLGDLTWQGVVLAAVALLVLRPVAAWISLARCDLEPSERRAIAFFGVRGVGSFYYLAYAESDVFLEGGGLVWSTVSLVVLGSIVLHGVSATPVMDRLDATRQRPRRARRRSAGPEPNDHP